MYVRQLRRPLNFFLPLGSGYGKVIVAGMPKSGTTAIAKLLGESAKLPVCSDPFHLLDKRGIDFREELFSGRLSLFELWRKYRHHFKGRVVKDPNFPLFLGELCQFFPEAQFVFIVRDPRENIRSILSRLKMPGDPAEGNEILESLSGAWANVLNGKLPDMPGDDYLEKMAWRWRISAENYLDNQKHVRLIRYENFRINKRMEIEKLTKHLGYNVLKDISPLVDIQFQPKGSSSGSHQDFFGSENLARIERITAPLMHRFDYESTK